MAVPRAKPAEQHGRDAGFQIQHGDLGPSNRVRDCEEQGPAAGRNDGQECLTSPRSRSASSASPPRRR